MTRLGEAVLPLLRASLVPLQAAAGNAALIRIGSIAAGINGLLTVAIPTYVAAHPDAAIDVHEVTMTICWRAFRKARWTWPSAGSRPRCRKGSGFVRRCRTDLWWCAAPSTL